MAKPEITEELANQIYDVLVQECQAREDERRDFVFIQIGGLTTEWRFRGALGSGGKFYRSAGVWYVQMYPEDATEDRWRMVNAANARLIELHRIYNGG